MRLSEEWLYEKTESHIRRSIHRLSILSIVVVGLVWALLFLRESYIRFEDEKREISSEYLEQQRSILRERVDTVSDFIVTYRRQAEERLRRTVRERVDRAHAVATAIIEENQERLSQEELQRRVVEALRHWRWRDGNSYIWINTYDLDVILFPTEPEMEERSLTDYETVRAQAQIAREQGSGFSEDLFRKPDALTERESPQISYVRDLGYWDWYLGSADFLDVFEQELQEELLEVIAEFRYEGNYIFIDTFDGYAILMNGERVNPPQYKWELEDSEGLKILQEQLRVARENPEGGFLQYVWYENSLERHVDYLSFVRTIDDWEWKIGTGAYLELIEDEIARREADLWSRTWRSILIGTAVVGGVLLLVALAYRGVNRRIATVFEAMRTALLESRKSLLDVNATLEERVQREIERRVRLHRLAITDGLTGIFNRRHFDDVLKSEWQRAFQSERPLALIIADIDRFKEYNDSYGHPRGDEALVQVAGALHSVITRYDGYVARYGGEEFAAILSDATLTEALDVARLIQREVANLDLPAPDSEEGVESLTVSLGVGSTVPRLAGRPESLVEAVDRALYAAKGRGGNHVECVPPEQTA